MTDQPRTPAGSPEGGQFTAAIGAEPVEALPAPPRTLVASEIAAEDLMGSTVTTTDGPASLGTILTGKVLGFFPPHPTNQIVVTEIEVECPTRVKPYVCDNYHCSQAWRRHEHDIWPERHVIPVTALAEINGKPVAVVVAPEEDHG